MFSIHSVSSDRELVFSSRKGEYFWVELKGHTLSATTDVWATPDAPGLKAFFQEIACYHLPWTGARAWASLEGEFEISATCTTLGQVIFSVKLMGQIGDTEEWEAQARLDTEFGQLQHIARQASGFFS